MHALATFASHYGVPDLGMPWWLFLGLLGHVARHEARALLQAVEGPMLALDRLTEEGASRLQYTLAELEEQTE